MKDCRNVIDRPIDCSPPENASTANLPGGFAKSRSIAGSKMDFRPGKRNQFRVRIDIHVHMVGNGAAGSGGWLRLKGWHRALAGFMLRQLSMPASALEGDLEKIYAEHLLRLVRESSLDAVVYLRTNAFTILTGRRAMIWARCLCERRRSRSRQRHPNFLPAFPFILRGATRWMSLTVASLAARC